LQKVTLEFGMISETVKAMQRRQWLLLACALAASQAQAAKEVPTSLIAGMRVHQRVWAALHLLFGLACSQNPKPSHLSPV
jgi:hypothetical protein